MNPISGNTMISIRKQHLMQHEVHMIYHKRRL